MKKLLILGAGAAGTMAANRLHQLLDTDEWKITLVDQNETHYYQPGFLFIPFGIYNKADVIKPKQDFMPHGVELLMSAIESIEPTRNSVHLSDGRKLDYDFLIIATGADIHPEQTPGLGGDAWGKSIHTFYSLEGALALFEKLKTWPLQTRLQRQFTAADTLISKLNNTSTFLQQQLNPNSKSNF